ncbi:hypothetical protein PRO82_001444 [Candidatus Protochlamydia amoebophila]|nr:hypothetical protein [Candidatus Protochlamydia amoebophila]
MKRCIINLIKEILRQPSSNSISYSETQIFVFKVKFDQFRNELKNSLMSQFQFYVQYAEEKTFVVRKQIQA